MTETLFKTTTPSLMVDWTLGETRGYLMLDIQCLHSFSQVLMIRLVQEAYVPCSWLAGLLKILAHHHHHHQPHRLVDTIIVRKKG